MKFPWMAKDGDAQLAEIQAMHRRVYGTPEGQQVLTMLLEGLYHYDIAKTTDEIALKNFATDYVNTKLGPLRTFEETKALLQVKSPE